MEDIIKLAKDEENNYLVTLKPMNALFLETKRLLLKFPTPDDLTSLLQLRADPEVMRYIGNGSTHQTEQVERFLTHAIPYQERHGIGFCSIFEKNSGEFVGQAGLFHLGFDDTQPDIEVAYRLLPKFWGKGYATELAKALVHWGFTHLPVKKLVSAAHPDNLASQNVLKKAGFIPIGTVHWYSGQDVIGFEIYKDDAIELVPYDPTWPTLAALIIQKLREILPTHHVLDIQHVGSTAIPGLLAKPIIDIQIAVDSLNAIKSQAISQLKALGYAFWDENPDPTRLFFVKGMPPYGDKREAHVHIVEPASKHWQDKRQFRDYLLAHPNTAHDYAQLKQALAETYRYDREQYTQSKTSFIEAVLRQASQDKPSRLTPKVIFITGSSGAGKTTLLKAVESDTHALQMACYYFDSIGVPTVEEMNKVYGSGSEWQKAMTYHWVRRIQQHDADKEMVILEGQINLDFIVAACRGWGIHNYHIVLVHCDEAIRHQRLAQFRQQPELIHQEMDHWAQYLRQQALAHQALILDSGKLSVQEMATKIKRLRYS